MKATNHPVIVEALRTAIGKKKGVFSETRSDSLGAAILKALLEKTQVAPIEVDDLITGCVTQINEQGLNISRNIALAAGMPVQTPGISVNRLCASSLEAIVLGVAKVGVGIDDIVVSLGVENMTRISMGSDGGAMNPEILDRFAIVPQGTSAELIAQKWEQPRELLDRFAYESHKKALAAMDAGKFGREILPVQVEYEGKTVEVKQDETPRRNTSVEKLASLSPSFQADGKVTAGNSSQISDGAAGVMVMTEKNATERNITPRARIVATATVGVDPTIMLTGPIPATQKVLKKAKMKIDQIDVIECNEAFAPVPVVFAHEMGIDLERLNPRGGAIALGHPLGSTGARLLTTCLHTLEDEKKQFGLITMCIGFGQGIATIIERLG